MFRFNNLRAVWQRLSHTPPISAVLPPSRLVIEGAEGYGLLPSLAIDARTAARGLDIMARSI